MAIKKVSLPPDQFRSRGYKTVATPFFLLKSRKNLEHKTRIGIIVGKSAQKTAAKRNFWKRQVLAGLGAREVGENDILMIALPAIDRLTKKEFKKELLKALSKTQL